MKTRTTNQVVAGYVEIDRRRFLARTRFATGCLAGIAFAGVVWDALAFFSLCIMAFVWTCLFVDAAARLHETALVDDDRLHDPDKEVRMKRV